MYLVDRHKVGPCNLVMPGLKTGPVQFDKIFLSKWCDGGHVHINWHPQSHHDSKQVVRSTGTHMV